MGTEADFSDSGFSYDFERQSKSTDEKAIPNVLAWLRKEYRERDEIDDNIVKDDNAVMSAAQNNKHEPEFDSDSKMDVDECNDLTRYKRSVPGVVNVSGYLFPQELSKALETAKPESKKKCTSQSEEKFPEEEPKLHKENIEMEFEQLKRENTELETQMSVMIEELEKYRKKIETLQVDLDESKVEVKRLQFKEEYKERELANLKRDLQSKEQKWKQGNEHVEKVMADIGDLWDDVDYMQESLKNSQERNEILTFEVDELTIMMQEMKREYWMEHNRGGCGHLREEVVLLNGSLELKEQRIVLLESQVDAFKAERSSFTNAAQSMEREMEILNNEKATTKTQFHERNRETSKIISDLQDEIAKLQKEKSTLSSELSKESGEDNQLCEITCEKSWITRKLEDHITRLRRENCSLTARVSKAYEKDVQLIELKEKVEFNKHQLKNLTEAAKASLNNKEKEVEEANRIIKKQDETIKNLIEEIRQERCDRDRLEVQSEKIKELEAQLQRMEDIKRNTSADALVLEVRPESSEKEHLKKAMEAKECRSHRAKELHKRIGHLENQLRERDDLINATLTSLNNNKRSLMEANNTIDLLTEQLEREKSDKETLRRALEVYESNSFAKKEMTEKIEKLEEQLQEMDDLREKTPRSLREKERSLEEAHVEIKELTQQMALEKPDKKCFKRKIKARKGIANRLNLVQKGTKRDTQGKGSIMAHVGKRLKNLLRKQQEVKGKEISTGCVLEKSRDDLRSNLNYSDKEFSSMRRQLEDSKFENADLKQRLGEKDGKVRALETSTKQLQEDLQKTHKYLKEREVGLDDVNETLQLKCSLLTTLGAELCLRSKELTQTNKDKGLEITRIEANLGEVKKELDIATSIVEKQNEQCANFKTCAMRKTLDAEEMQNELRRLSTRLECAKSEKEKFQKALLTATARLENERFFAEKEQKAPHVKVNSSLKELNTKGKQFWDTKIDLQGAAVPLPALEDEKAEQEENLAAFQGKLLHELNLLEETQYVENEKESPLLLTIGSAEREMAKLTRENSRQFRTELLHNGFEKPSESPCEERTFSTLEIKRVKATPYKITFFDDGNCQGDTKHKWVNTSGMEKRFETSGDPHFNRTSTGAEVDHSTRNLSAHRSLNIVSVLHCNG
ncbi:myosin-10-like [Pocillopora damicornis]|uniref:myosin-10-like n=1 Tax=Pocillopora damicornis TaxID=46731 RepID=UPI000F5515BA|nr:myosin-10-like [Pocillopora damicornis]